jgi:hypothetical protein
VLQGNLRNDQQMLNGVKPRLQSCATSTDYWETHEPFGGASGTGTGWGRIGGRYTMLDMTDLKTVVLDVGGLD